MIKHPIFEQFLNNDEEYSRAQEFWKLLILKSSFSNDTDYLYNRDGNPIIYMHIETIERSIRIIQEQFEYHSPAHLGAWIEPKSEFRPFEELVISVELSNVTLRPVKRLVARWLNPLKFQVSNAYLERLIVKSLPPRKYDRGLELW